MVIDILSEDDMRMFGTRLGKLLDGGDTVELIGDVGSGKTTLTKGIAKGMGVDEDVQSPSFTISRMYDASRGLTLAHYDFYRLEDAGIMSDELTEAAHDTRFVTIIEWASIVAKVLPEDRLVVRFSTPTETSRHLEINGMGERSRVLLEKMA